LLLLLLLLLLLVGNIAVLLRRKWLRLLELRGSSLTHDGARWEWRRGLVATTDLGRLLLQELVALLLEDQKLLLHYVQLLLELDHYLLLLGCDLSRFLQLCQLRHGGFLLLIPLRQ